MGIHKNFDDALCKKHDPESRLVMKTAVAKWNPPIILTDNPDDKGIDLMSPDGKIWVELEHRPFWKWDEFPDPQVHFPERKKRLFNYGVNFYYVILSQFYTRAGMIKSTELVKHMTKENLVEVPNVLVP